MSARRRPPRSPNFSANACSKDLRPAQVPGNERKRARTPLRLRAEHALRESKAPPAPAADEREKLLHDLRVHQIELEMQNEELRRAQIELTEAHNRYQDLYENAPVGYLTLDAQGVIQSANLMAVALLGVERVKQLGRPVWRFLPGEASPAWRHHLARVLTSGRKESCELPVRRSDRSSATIRFETTAVEGPALRYHCALIDMSATKRAEQALEALNRTLERRIAASTKELRDREGRLQAILDTAADGILTIDGRGTILSVNPAAERLFGYGAQEMVGDNVSRLMPSPHRQRHDGYLARYLATGESQFIGRWRELTGRRGDGATFPIEIVVSQFNDGEPKFTAIVRDITERKRLQWELVHRVTEEQQAFGRSLHDGVAQQLAGAEMMVSVLHGKLRADYPRGASVAADLLAIIRGAQDQIRATIRGLLPYTVRTAGLGAALRELALSTAKLHKIDCTVQVDDGAAGTIDPSVAMQLYYIACEAVHNAGRHARPTRIAITLRGRGGAVRMNVTDDGVGIDTRTGAKGAGIEIMRYRANLIGADLTVRRGQRGGTVVACSLARGH